MASRASMAAFNAPAKFSAISCNLLRRRSAQARRLADLECKGHSCVIHSLPTLCRVLVRAGMPCQHVPPWIVALWKRGGTGAKIMGQLICSIATDALQLILDVVQVCAHATADAVNQAREVKGQDACCPDLL